MPAIILNALGRLRSGLPGLLVLSGLYWSQGIVFAQPFDWRGTLETEWALNTQETELQKADFTFTPEISGALGDWGQFTLIGQFRVDAADKLEPGQPDTANAVRGSLNRRSFAGDSVDMELREAYVDVYAGESFLRVGKQQVVWGQADGLRVLDAVNPLHFREFILGDFEDRRIPLWMINFERPVGDAVLQLLWIPDHTYNDIPVDGTFAISSPRFAPAISAGPSGEIDVRPIKRPDRLIRDDDYGARLTGFTGGWDWSLNYLYTFDDTPVVRRREMANGGVQVSPSYERTHLFGGSASNAFGKTTLRFETGWTTDRYWVVDDPSDDDGVASSGEISYVIGADYQLDGDTFLSAQLFQSLLMDAPEHTRRDDLETTITLLARRDFRHDTIEAEAIVIMDANDGDGLLQLSLDYDFSDRVTIGLGADIFFGDRSGLYGQFDDADRMTFRISYGF